MKNDEIYDLLLKSLDYNLTYEEKIRLDNALANNNEIGVEREKLLKMRSAIANQQYSFSKDFNNKVMQNLSAIGGQVVSFDFSASLYKTFKRFAIAGAAAILILVGSIYISDGKLSIDNVTGLTEVNSQNVSSLILYDF